MTGISDVFKGAQRASAFAAAAARSLVMHTLPPGAARRVLQHLGSRATRHLTCPQPVLPDPRATLDFNSRAPPPPLATGYTAMPLIGLWH